MATSEDCFKISELGKPRNAKITNLNWEKWITKQPNIFKIKSTPLKHQSQRNLRFSLKNTEKQKVAAKSSGFMVKQTPKKQKAILKFVFPLTTSFKTIRDNAMLVNLDLEIEKSKKWAK